MKVNQLPVQQQQLHPQQQQHYMYLPPFVVRRATNHNLVGTPFGDARAAARCNIATKSANERIGVQEDTNKNANGWEKKKKQRKKQRRREAAAAAKTNNQNQHKSFIWYLKKNLEINFVSFSKTLDIYMVVKEWHWLHQYLRVCMSCCGWYAYLYSNDAGQQADLAVHDWGPRDPPNPFFCQRGDQN